MSSLVIFGLCLTAITASDFCSQLATSGEPIGLYRNVTANGSQLINQYFVFRRDSNDFYEMSIESDYKKVVTIKVKGKSSERTLFPKFLLRDLTKSVEKNDFWICQFSWVSYWFNIIESLGVFLFN